MSTTATLYGNWRRRPTSKRVHLFRFGTPVCGARIVAASTVKVRRGAGDLNDLCYDCLSYGASGR